MSKIVIIYFIFSLIFASPLQAQELSTKEPSPIRKEITEKIEATKNEEIAKVEEQKADEEEVETTSEDKHLEEITSNYLDELERESEADGTIAPVAPTPSPLPTIVPTALISATPSGEFTHDSSMAPATTSASTAATPATPSADSVIEDQNQAVVGQTTEQTASTGSNNVEAADRAEISTATAAAQSVTSTEVNTTIVGQDTTYGVSQLTTAQSSLDLAHIQKNCQPRASNSSNSIAINNSAVIYNSITANADTGNNFANALTASTKTGDAVAEANISNIANTSLIGNCWFYYVINVFSPNNTAIILPNEEQFLESDSQAQALQPYIVTTDQSASITAEVQTTTNTGSNSAQTVSTGSTHSQSDIASIINTSLYGNSWFLIKVTNPQYWKGTLIGASYFNSQDGSSLYFWLSPQAALAFGSQDVEADNGVTITNSATVNTIVSLSATTGNNTAKGTDTSISTGDAYTELEILNLLNTTVIGNNWYFVMLNLFDDFAGEVSIARPDLAMLAPAKTTVAPGDTISYKVAVINGGNSSAKDITVTQQRSGWHDNDGGSTKSWSIPTLADQESTVIPITLSIPSNAAEGTYTISYQVSNTYTEHDQENNTATFIVTVEEPKSIELVEYVYPQTLLYTYPEYSQPQLFNYRYPKREPAQQSEIQGMQTEEPQLTIPFPSPLDRAFCIKNWELCSAAGLLLTAGPVKAIERRKYFTLNKGRT